MITNAFNRTNHLAQDHANDSDTRKSQQDPRQKYDGGSSEVGDTAIGSEFLGEIFGIAVTQVFGIPLPEMPGNIDAGHVIDAVDEYHRDRGDGRFQIGRRNTINQEFNFGGVRYNRPIDPDSDGTDNSTDPLPWQGSGQASSLESEMPAPPPMPPARLASPSFF